MNRLLLILYFIFTGSSCAIKPVKIKPISYQYEHPVKIGFISRISERLTHKHLGITIFGNFEKDLDVKWKLNDYIYESLSKELRTQKNYNLINISNDPATAYFFDNENLIEEVDEFRVVNKSELNKIIDKLVVDDLDAVIFVSSPTWFYSKAYRRVKESRGQQGDHGFASRSGYGMSFATGIGLTMYSISPEAHYVGWQYLGLFEKVNPQPLDYENLTTTELASYEKQFKNNIDLKIRKFINKIP